MEPILQIEKVSKAFPGVQALDRVDLKVYPGEIHAVMGENGAGKSTLMKIIAGIYTPDSGDVYLKGKKTAFKSSHDSLLAGISMIHQELMPVMDMTVEENIFLGREIFKKSGFLDKKKMHHETVRALNEVGMDIDPQTLLRGLSVAKTQMIEIAKAISYQSDVLIMDEPTSSLTNREIVRLYDVMNTLKQQGVAIIFITHKLEEVFTVADRISVYRDGKYIATNPAGELDENKLVELMVGREINIEKSERSEKRGEKLLEVENLNVADLLHDISFYARAGEIVGFGGLMGAGRTETAEAIFGLRKMTSGRVLVRGKETKIDHPNKAIAEGIALMTEDRKLMGLNLIASVRENITIVSLKDFIKRGWINKKEEAAAADEFIERLSIKTPSQEQQVVNLSGGNQQKVVIAKWLLKDCDIIIMDEPTRGIDIAAKNEIYTLIKKMAGEGKTIVLISSEMEEIIMLSDRIYVFNSGYITGELSAEEVTQENILTLAAKNVEVG